MDIIQIATETFMKNLDKEGDGLDMGDVTAAMQGLMGEDNGPGLSSMLENMKSHDMGSMVSSWLGDSDNENISGDQINNLFGSDQIGAFAKQLGLDPANVLSSLTQAVPDAVDKSSSGGQLLESLGSLDGLMGLAGKFLGR
ncbi:YidB family protein [Candidatus Venteria ishoeyi]|uniref:DUF937 domain-containing protein n=1 Tax=Candidatus Venteria ishoeyi TaxID=1899563 RepID=A0A1H6FF21_9GAMM|nr:YidB family protein [Candidatus Venteria ishoeyi]SEH08617.1 Uncharacterised protein [Candidatus Venteria ishoeyi]